jgi:hypothetical protein
MVPRLAFTGSGPDGCANRIEKHSFLSEPQGNNGADWRQKQAPTPHLAENHYADDGWRSRAGRVVGRIGRTTLNMAPWRRALT